MQRMKRDLPIWATITTLIILLVGMTARALHVGAPETRLADSSSCG